MKVKSKKNNLLNYFLYKESELSPAYVASCKKFFKDIEKKQGIKFKDKFKLEC